MDVCPKCHQKLISHASTKCNWCGFEFTDPAYLEQAEAKRETRRREQAIHDARSLASYQALITWMNNDGAPMPVHYLTRFDPLVRRQAKRQPPKESSSANDDDESK